MAFSEYMNFNEIYILSGPSMKHGQPEAHPSLFHSGLYWGSTHFCGKNDAMCCFVIKQKVLSFFFTKKDQKILWHQIDFLIVWSFGLTIFWSGAKQMFCFRESMLVLDHNGRIQALGFLAWWQLTSHALIYNLP